MWEWRPRTTPARIDHLGFYKSMDALEPEQYVGMNLSHIIAHQAWMKLAHLSHVNFTESDLEDAYGVQVTLHHAIFHRAKLVRADLALCYATHADFAGADMRHADLSNGKLNRAVFDGADLRSASLACSTLIHAGFTGTDLEGADLSEADLRFATFRGVDLTKVNLKHANMWPVGLEDVTLPRNLEAFPCALKIINIEEMPELVFRWLDEEG